MAGEAAQPIADIERDEPAAPVGAQLALQGPPETTTASLAASNSPQGALSSSSAGAQPKSPPRPISPTVDEVEGMNCSLSKAIDLGWVAFPPPMPWGQWRTWRADYGLSLIHI